MEQPCQFRLWPKFQFRKNGWNQIFTAGFLTLILACPLACSKSSPPAPEAQNTQTHLFRGIVRGLDPEGGSILVEHEDVPGYMPSMTMPFAVKEPAELKGLKVGDGVVFDFLVTPDDSWAQAFRPIPAGAIRLPKKEAPASSAANQVPRVQEGDPLPNFQLVDQKNQKISAETYSGKPLLLTFIFTRCPVPNFCPKISSNFESLAGLMANDPTLADPAQLLSISFDPEFDSPEVLDAYGKTFSADLEQWRFATGTPEEIAKLTQAFAVYTKADKGSIDHGLCTALVAPDGTIAAIWRGNGWKPEEVIAALKALSSSVPGEDPNS